MFWSDSMNKWLQCACPRNIDVWFRKIFLVLRKSYLWKKITWRIQQLYSHIYVRQLGSYVFVWMEMLGLRWCTCYRIPVYFIHALMTYAVQLLIYDLYMFSHCSVLHLAVILFNEFKPLAEYHKFIQCCHWDANMKRNHNCPWQYAYWLPLASLSLRNMVVWCSCNFIWRYVISVVQI